MKTAGAPPSSIEARAHSPAVGIPTKSEPPNTRGSDFFLG